MNLLMAALSYDGDAMNGNHQKIRDTWGKDVLAAGATLRFFIDTRLNVLRGGPKQDEVIVPWLQPCKNGHPQWVSKRGCCQNYWEFETKEILKWSLANGYDYTFLFQNDTFCIPRLLVKCGFEKGDVSGHWRKIEENLSYGTKTAGLFINDPNDPTDTGEQVYDTPEYGAGVFLSRKAAEVFISHAPLHWQTEFQIGQPLGEALASGELTAYDIPNYRGVVSWHYVSATNGLRYYPKTTWMKEMYERYGRDGSAR